MSDQESNIVSIHGGQPPAAAATDYDEQRKLELQVLSNEFKRMVDADEIINALVIMETSEGQPCWMYVSDILNDPMSAIGRMEHTKSVLLERIKTTGVEQVSTRGPDDDGPRHA